MPHLPDDVPHLPDDVPHLPDDVRPYDATPTFTQESLPEALRRRHTTRAGVWAKIVVLEGRLLFRILAPEVSETVLTPETPGIVAPQVPHEVRPLGPVRFFVEFHRAPAG